MSFAKMEAKAMPTQVNAAKISEVGPIAPSKSGGVYLVCPIKVDAYDSGRGETFYFCFRPEWFTSQFQEEVLQAESLEKYFQETHGEDVYEKNGVEKNVATSFSFVYTSNIANGDNNSLLQCLFPDSDEFDAFTEKLLQLNIDAAEPDLEALTKFLSEQLLDRKIGFVQKQAQIKTDRVNENGKPIYMKDNKYNVSSYFPITEAKVKSWVKSAKNSKSGLRLTFDPDTVL
ncbi:hypothetical protein UFOVP434_15 [uncultured Caudovirales phage]|uniref:Uncharacterized protein n=1 Tax=uncultured Caudovirales phage TaxID=2100421 RepID=A0A6J5MFK7_9CAUD|nr:hypothetical protein UFOVP434_15 [uncultured Caudovirales phage]